MTNQNRVEPLKDGTVVTNDLDASIAKKLKTILSAGPRAAAESKRLALGDPLSLEDASRLLAKFRSSPEGKEGVAAFLEKRKANFVVER